MRPRTHYQGDRGHGKKVAHRLRFRVFVYRISLVEAGLPIKEHPVAPTRSPPLLDLESTKRSTHPGGQGRVEESALSCRTI